MIQDIFEGNETVIYGVRKDRYGVRYFDLAYIVRGYESNLRSVALAALRAKETWPEVYAVTNSDELRGAWMDLKHYSHRGPEDSIVFHDFLDFLVTNWQGEKF